MGDTSDAEKKLYSHVAVDAIGQNVYLFCTSEGLGTVIRAYFDKDELTKAMKLQKNQEIVLVQSVGVIK